MVSLRDNGARRWEKPFSRFLCLQIKVFPPNTNSKIFRSWCLRFHENDRSAGKIGTYGSRRPCPTLEQLSNDLNHNAFETLTQNCPSITDKIDWSGAGCKENHRKRRGHQVLQFLKMFEFWSWGLIFKFAGDALVVLWVPENKIDFEQFGEMSDEEKVNYWISVDFRDLGQQMDITRHVSQAAEYHRKVFLIYHTGKSLW